LRSTAEEKQGVVARVFGRFDSYFGGRLDFGFEI